MSDINSQGKNCQPDFHSISMEECLSLPFPLSQDKREGDFQVVIKQSALNNIKKHGMQNKSIEVCGVLVGRLCKDDMGAFLYIESSIPGEYATHKATQVTFTAETWTYISNQMEKEYPDKKIVGWYHTHPGFGVFLSEMDMFIHRHFFNLPWQVAFVYDPCSQEQGMFLWIQGKAIASTIQLEEDMPEEKIRISLENLDFKSDSRQLDKRILKLEKRTRKMLYIFGILMMLVVGWLSAMTYQMLEMQKKIMIETKQEKPLQDIKEQSTEEKKQTIVKEQGK